ncbi:hypothetical protein TH66_17010 [Carbonactinospora thermoautotrophica]|uniref:Uncharacterized protein n=1 Tax=Carbonactinospora thermoautotrophica TaxID=1469144 RepID=A0A132MRP1_9ACTN|nr:hypothetical protein TH66_17010 [Carbonactinospora thermoautotrophica]
MSAFATLCLAGDTPAPPVAGVDAGAGEPDKRFRNTLSACDLTWGAPVHASSGVSAWREAATALIIFEFC